MLGVSLYPPAYVSARTFGQIRDDLYAPSAFIQANGVLDNVRYWMLEKGYFVLDTDDPIIATRLSNSLFFSMSLLGGLTGGFGFIRVGELELDRVASFDESDSSSLRREGTIVTARNFLTAYPELRETFEKDLTGQVNWVYPSMIIDIAVDLAQEILRSTYRDRILDYYYAYSSNQLGDWTSSFLLSWFSVESLLYERTEKYLQSLSVKKETVDAMMNWGIAHLITYLKTETSAGRLPGRTNSDVLKPKAIDDIDDLRKIRNRIVHEGKAPTESDAGRCLEVARRAFLDYMKMDGIDYDLFLRRVRALQGNARSDL